MKAERIQKQLRDIFLHEPVRPVLEAIQQAFERSIYHKTSPWHGFP